MKSANALVLVLYRVCQIVIVSQVSVFVGKVAAETCQIKIQTDELGKPRFRSILFPDGRKLAIVGHSHAVGIEEAISRIASGGEQSAFDSRLQEFIHSHQRDVFVDSQSDLIWLRQALRDQTLEFVAVEATPEFAAEKSRELVRLRSLLNALRVNDSLMAETLLTAQGAARFEFSTNQNLHQALVPIENPELFDRHRELNKTRFSALQDMRKLTDKYTNGDNYLLVAFEISNERLRAIHANRELRLPTLKQLKAPPEIMVQLQSWTKLEEVAYSIHRKRDEHNVSALLGLGKSGVLFIGYNHLNYSMSLLEARCLIQLRHKPQP